jgi:hypothetical protein
MAKNVVLCVVFLMISSCTQDGKSRGGGDMRHVEEYDENGKMASFGTTNKEGRREGLWEFRDEKGFMEAKGSFKDGFYTNKWIYAYRTYNGSDSIYWGIHDEGEFCMNLPRDWEVGYIGGDESPSYLKSYYKKDQNLGCLLFLSSADNQSLEDMALEVIAQYDNKADYHFYKNEEIKVNFLPAKRLLFESRPNGEKLLIETYIIKNEHSDVACICNCHTAKNQSPWQVEAALRVFSQIGFSILLK